MMRLVITSLVLGVVGCGAPRVAIEFRLAETEPASELVEFVLAGSPERFYLHREAVLGNADVASASVVQHGGSPAVELVLTQQGTARFAEFTEASLKKRVGILVNGSLVSVPLINAPITSGRAIVPGGFSESEALRIATALRH